MLWISGDTVLYDGVREVADRLEVDTAIVHLGGVKFPVSGPLRYTMTAAEAVELCGLIRPRTAIPIHYEGWKHFRQGRDGDRGRVRRRARRPSATASAGCRSASRSIWRPSEPGCGPQVFWYSGPSPPSGGVSRPPLAVIAPHWTQLV